jgi:hypothetical protein
VGIAGEEVSDELILLLKQLREILQEVGERKGHISRKLFEEHVRQILNAVGAISIQFRTIIEQGLSRGTLRSNVCKASKYSDQMLVSLLRAAPPDIQEE